MIVVSDMALTWIDYGKYVGHISKFLNLRGGKKTN